MHKGLRAGEREGLPPLPPLPPPPPLAAGEDGVSENLVLAPASPQIDDLRGDASVARWDIFFFPR